jgi:hypothetical protein
MYTQNELLFPHHVIPALANVRGDDWRDLVRDVQDSPETGEKTLAFTLMMVRLCGCIGCETDSYRAMKGCMACVVQILRRYKGTDEDLLTLYQAALDDVRRHRSEKSS